MKILCSIFLLLLQLSLFGQTAAYYPGGASINALAYNSIMLEGLDAVYHNPAQMVQAAVPFGLDISAEQRFGLSNFINPSLGMMAHVGKSHFGLSIHRYGIHEFAETNLGISYARPLAQNFQAGFRFNAHRLSIPNYGNANLMGVDLGLSSQVNSELSLSFQLYQPIKALLLEQYEKPARLIAGLSYSPSKKVSIVVEFEKIEDRALSPKTGFIYKPLSHIEIRAGVDLQRSSFGFGFGYSFSRTGVRAGYMVNRDLGGSPAMSLQWKK